MIDRESLEFMHMIRDRAAYRDAITEIKNALYDSTHGAYHSDLWAMVWSVINKLENRDVAYTEYEAKRILLAWMVSCERV